MATITWKGYTWGSTDGSSDPGFGTYDGDNVAVDANGYLNLSITNPTGIAPRGARLESRDENFGYGIYKVTVGSSLTSMDKNIVFGGLFPIRHETPYLEFDICETTKKDDVYSVVKIMHNMYYGDPGAPTANMNLYDIPSDAVQTHVMVWTKEKMTMSSYIGDNPEIVQPYFRTEFTSNVPEEGGSVTCIFNIWAYSFGAPGADDIDLTPTTIIVRDFSYIPFKKSTKGTRFLSKNYPNEEGLTARTTKQTKDPKLRSEKSFTQGEIHGS